MMPLLIGFQLTCTTRIANQLYCSKDRIVIMSVQANKDNEVDFAQQIALDTKAVNVSLDSKAH